MDETAENFKKFLIDVKSTEKDPMKIKTLIDKVSEGNESVKNILEVLNSMIDIEQKIST